MAHGHAVGGGEIEVYDSSGKNIALGKKYKIEPVTLYELLSDDGKKLTDGKDGPHDEGHCIGWTTVRRPEEKESWAALIEVPWEKGVVLLATSKFSDFRARNYRLTTNWESLMRHIALYMLPDISRTDSDRTYVPLEAHTQPRVWITPEQGAKLIIQTLPEAKVDVECPTIEDIKLNDMGSGRFEAEISPLEGKHTIKVQARTQDGSNRKSVDLEVSDRKTKYREAIDRNIQWFFRSGMVPDLDGTKGICTQRCMTWFDGDPFDGCYNDPVPFRLDNNANSAVAIYLYGEVTGDEMYRKVALNVVNNFLQYQYLDPTKASFGGWPWTFKTAKTIFLWDDNTRVAVSLLWFYAKEKNIEHLKAALRNTELNVAICQDDGTVVRHATSPDEIDKIGRKGFRDLRFQAYATHFDTWRWWWAYGMTGDELYKKFAASTTSLPQDLLGLPVAYYLGQDPAVKDKISEDLKMYLEWPSVRKYGATTSPGSAQDYVLAYRSDSGISALQGEPLTDQLYTTSDMVWRLWDAYKATGDKTCLDAFHRLADYLVRIQMVHLDPRLDGCWMRGFDIENWEYYGANYDPWYGPYSAYTGWSNSFISIALALYLLDEGFFPPKQFYKSDSPVKDILKEIRAIQPNY